MWSVGYDATDNTTSPHTQRYVPAPYVRGGERRARLASNGTTRTRTARWRPSSRADGAASCTCRSQVSPVAWAPTSSTPTVDWRGTTGAARCSRASRIAATRRTSAGPACGAYNEDVSRAKCGIHRYFSISVDINITVITFYIILRCVTLLYDITLLYIIIYYCIALISVLISVSILILVSISISISKSISRSISPVATLILV